MASVRFLGLEGEASSRTPWVAVGVAIAGALVLRAMLRPRREAEASGPPLVELTSALGAANAEILAVTEASRRDVFRADLDYRLRAATAPGLLRTCVPWQRWRLLSAAERRVYTDQVRQGSLVQTPTATGVCFTPTSRGVAGFGPPTRIRRSRGLLTSRETVTTVGGGSTSGELPEPGLLSILEDLLGLFTRPDPVLEGVPA